MITAPKSKESLYSFGGKEFKSDEWTVKQLNYALALNKSTQRYVKVKKLVK